MANRVFDDVLAKQRRRRAHLYVTPAESVAISRELLDHDVVGDAEAVVVARVSKVVNPHNGCWLNVHVTKG